jgi:hypothetical protein
MLKVQAMGQSFNAEVKKEKLNINHKQVKYITQIIPGSPAEALGIMPGDLLGTINGRPALDIDLLELNLKKESIYYFIYNEERHESKYIEAGYYPLGIETEDSTQLIFSRVFSGEQSLSDLALLWERQEWKWLLQACLSYQMLESFFSRFIRWSRKLDFNGPVILMHGVVLYELGKKQKGYALIKRYHDEMMRRWTIDWHAITYYYMGLNARATGNEEEALDCFYKSEEFCSNARLQELLGVQGIKEQPKNRWGMQRFPVMFELKDTHSEQVVCFRDVLENMDHTQMVIVCVMPSYRSNSPYNEKMKVFENLHTLFDSIIAGMLVITDTLEADDWNLERMENEQSLLEQGKPVYVLEDIEREVIDVFDQNSTPNFYVVNKSGIIIDSMDFELEQIWSYIDSLNKAKSLG